MSQLEFRNSAVFNSLVNDLSGMFYRSTSGQVKTMSFVSPTSSNITGFTPSELINNDFFLLVHPEDLAFVKNTHNEAIINKTTCNVEYRIVCKQKKTRWIKEISEGVYDKDGNLLCVEGFIEEITEKKDYSSLSSTFKALQNALNASSIVSITDAQGKIIYVNEMFCKYSKYSFIELVGNTHGILNSKYHSKEFFADLWKTISSGNTWRGEIKNKAKDGEYYWVDTVISPVYDNDGKIIQYLSVRNIITEKKEIEFVIQEINNRISTKTEEDYFKELTLYFTQAFNVKYAFLGHYLKDEHAVETISFCSGGKHQENFKYSLENTPCAKVLNGEQCIYPSNVQQLFPKDEDLKTLNAHSYFGIPLLNDKNNPLGVLVLIDEKPMVDTDKKQQLLSFLAPRAANELQRSVMQRKLKQSEEFNRGILRAMSSHIAVLDKHGNILSVNEAWDQFSITNGETNLSRTAAGSNYFEVCEKTIATGDKYAAEALQGIKAVLNKQLEKFEMEYPCHSPTEQRWYVLNASNYNADEPRVVLRHVDITQRKVMENKLRDQEVFYRTLIEHSHDVVTIQKIDGTIIYNSPNNAAIFGYEAYENINKKDTEFIHPDDLEEAQKAWESMIRIPGRVVKTVSRYKVKSGEYRWIECRQKLVIESGKDPYCIVNSRDVHQQVLMEHELKNSEERYRTLFDRNLSGVYRIDLNGYVLECNPAFATLIGYTQKEDVVGKHVRELYKNVTDSNFYNTIEKNNGRLHNYQSCIQLNNGKIIYTLENAATITNGGGISFMEGTITDITEQKLAEQKINEALNELKLISKINKASLEHKPIDYLVEETLNVYYSILPLIGGRFYLLDEESNKLNILADKITLNENILNLIESRLNLKIANVIPTLKSKDSLFKKAIKSKAPLILNKKEDIIAFLKEHTSNLLIKQLAPWVRRIANIQSFAIIPFLADDKVFGLAVLTSDFELNEKDKEKIERFTAQVNAALAKTQAEQKLKESEERYRGLFERMNEGLVYSSKEGEILMVNPRYCQITGYLEEELLGKNIYNLLFEKRVAKKLKSKIEDREKGLSEQYEETYITKKGRKIWVSISASPQLDDAGNFIGVMSVVSDISMRKYAELELEKTQNRFRELVNNSSEITCVVNLDGHISYISPSVENALGHTPDDVVGKNIFEFIHPDDVGAMLNDIQQKKSIIKKSNYDPYVVRRVKHKYFDGWKYFRMIASNQTHNPDIKGIIINAQDVTELINAQDDISKAYQSVAKERTQALKYQSRLLSAQINPHFLFNALNSVQYYILNTETEPALEFVSDFAKLIRATLKNSLHDHISIQEETKFLTEYLNLEQKRFKNKFEYSITLDDSIDGEDIYIPPMLLQPYVENTVVHGLANKQDKGKVEITFIDEGSNMLCTIDDNGIGREHAIRLRTMSKGAEHVSLATDLTALRLDTLNKVAQGKYSSKIVDKKAKNGRIMGTRVEVRFPKITYIQ
jgi:PAS domain S-box-containing protein